MFSFLGTSNCLMQTEEEEKLTFCVGWLDRNSRVARGENSPMQWLGWSAMDSSYLKPILWLIQKYCGVAGWPAEPTSHPPRRPTSKASFQYGAAGPWRWFYSQGVVCWEDRTVDGGEAGTGLLRCFEQRQINSPWRFTCSMLSGPKSTWISKRWGVKIKQILQYLDNR